MKVGELGSDGKGNKEVTVSRGITGRGCKRIEGRKSREIEGGGVRNRRATGSE